MALISQYLKFVLKTKKFWLLPVILFLALLGTLLVLGQGSILAPLIYSIW